MNLSNLFGKLFAPKKDQSATQIPGLKSGKMRQYMVLGVLAAAVYFGLYLIFASSAEDKPKKQVVAAKSMITTHVATGGEVVDVKDRWIGTAGNQMASQDKRLSSQEQATKDLLNKFAQLQTELRDRRADPAATTTPTPPPSPTASVPPRPSKDSPPNPPNAPASYPPSSPGAVASGTIPPPTAAPAPIPTFAIGHLHLASDKPALPATHTTTPAKAATGAKPAAERMSGDNFLPLGFTKAKLLGGILVVSHVEARG